MSCGCSSGSGYDGGIYGGVCDTDTPYPSVSHESVPSLIDNLVYALYGAITKDVTSGKVVWNIPCDPSNIPATINNIPRNEGEGLLCYIVRALNLTTTSGFVTVNGVQTLSNKTLDATCSLLGNATTATTATTLATGRTIALSGDVTGTATSFNGSANITIPVTINAGSVTPADLSTGGPYWDTSGNVGIGTSSPSSDIEIVDGTRSLRIDANLSPTGNSYITATGSTNGLLVGTTDAKSVSFFTNNTNRVSVESSGEINTQANPIINCPTTAKAWGGGTSAGVIDAQTFNIFTITRSGLGNYLVTTLQPIVGHQIVATPKSATGNQATAGAFSTTQFRVYTFGGGGDAADCAFQFVVFGD